MADHEYLRRKEHAGGYKGLPSFSSETSKLAAENARRRAELEGTAAPKKTVKKKKKKIISSPDVPPKRRDIFADVAKTAKREVAEEEAAKKMPKKKKKETSPYIIRNTQGYLKKPKKKGY